MKEYVFSEKGNRDINEDSYCVEKVDDKCIYIVADGCGGHSSGEIASRLICDSLPELLFECDDTADSIKNGINLCNDIVNIGLHFILKNVRPYAASCSEA